MQELGRHHDSFLHGCGLLHMGGSSGVLGGDEHPIPHSSLHDFRSMDQDLHSSDARPPKLWSATDSEGTNRHAGQPCMRESLATDSEMVKVEAEVEPEMSFDPYTGETGMEPSLSNAGWRARTRRVTGFSAIKPKPPRLAVLRRGAKDAILFAKNTSLAAAAAPSTAPSTALSTAPSTAPSTALHEPSVPELAELDRAMDRQSESWVRARAQATKKPSTVRFSLP